MKSVLITGANRGLGFELVRVFAEHDWHVYAACRSKGDFSKCKNSNNIEQLELNVTSEESIASLVKNIDSLDVLINNAGVADRDFWGKVRELSDIDEVAEIFKVNTIAPRFIADRLTPALQKGESKLVVTISSVMSSIAGTSDFNLKRWEYSSSKTAVNFAMLGYAHENKDITSMLVHPGWLRTDMGGPDAPEDPTVAAQKIYELTQAEKPVANTLIDTDGKVIPF